jgi:hypothetical protein
MDPRWLGLGLLMKRLRKQKYLARSRAKVFKPGSIGRLRRLWRRRLVVLVERLLDLVPLLTLWPGLARPAQLEGSADKRERN